MNDIKKFIKDLYCRFNDDAVTSLASQLSYSILAAIFPFLIFLMTLVGYSTLNSEDVLASLGSVLPSTVFELISKTVVDVVDGKSGNLMSISLILAIWSASAGFRAVIIGLNKAYDEPEKRGYFKITIVTLLCTLGLAFIIICTFILLVLGDVLGSFLKNYLQISTIYIFLWNILRYFISVFALVIVFASLYYFTPCKKLKLRQVIPGALFTTSGWVIASVIFSFYVNNFSNYSRLYGSLGALFALMTWLYITSVIILLGGEVNATIAGSKGKNSNSEIEKDCNTV